MKLLIIILLTFQHALGCVNSLLTRLDNIKHHKTLKINFDNTLNDSSYTLSPLNFFGIHNHFQGVYIKDNKVFLTGADKNKKQADLFIYDIKEKNTLRKKLNSTKKHWHAGSFQSYKEQLVIPIERLSDPLTSKIIQYDVTNNKTVTLFEKSTNKTGALDFLNIEGKDYIVLFDPKEISIYTYPGFDLYKSFKPDFFTGSAAKVVQGCNGKTYFLNLTNDGIFPPILNNNIIDVYEFDMSSLNLTKISTKKYTCKACNFRGAVNLLVEDKFKIVSTSMYLELFEKVLFVDILQEHSTN